MMEQDWTHSTVTQGHLQSLVSQGIKMAAELMGSRMVEEPVSPMPVEGYVVSFAAFYERGFGVSSHQFHHSLLEHYHLELHNLTPSGILHIASFMTLCVAYMRIDPHFDLWNYFFRVWRTLVPDAELTIAGEGAWLSMLTVGMASILILKSTCPN
jgi:hypothetical protein